jgi:type II secretory pathway component PulC
MRSLTMAALAILTASIIIPTASIHAEQNNPTITRLVMRDRIIVISQGEDEVKYSVKTKDGDVINANLNEAELAAKHPDIYEQVRPAYAGDNKMPTLMMLETTGNFEK